MPDSLGPPSEFGGKVGRNRVQPPPHEPTASEQLMLTYTTGDPSGINPFTKKRAPDNGESWEGLLPLKEQIALRKAAGDLEKGQVWEELKQKGGA